jgi:PAS domain S-box-containing protein
MRYERGDPTTATAAEITRNFGHWQSRALQGPVFVTHHGKPRVVMVSADHYAIWKNDPAPHENGGGIAFETRFGAVLDHTAEAFLSLDADLRIECVNGVAERYFGAPRTRLVGQEMLSLYPTLEGSLFLDRIRAVIRSGVADRVEGRSVIFCDRHVSTKIFPFPGGVGLLFSNVTEELAQAEELLAAKSYFKALDQSKRSAVIKLNLRGAISSHSRNFCSIIGLSNSELIGIRLDDLICRASRHDFHLALERVLQEREPTSCSVELLNKAQDLIAVDMNMAPLMAGFAAEGAILHAELVAPDQAVNSSQQARRN